MVREALVSVVSDGSTVALLDSAVYSGVEPIQYKPKAMARDALKAAAAYFPDELMEAGTTVRSDGCSPYWSLSLFASSWWHLCVLQSVWQSSSLML